MNESLDSTISNYQNYNRQEKSANHYRRNMTDMNNRVMNNSDLHEFIPYKPEIVIRSPYGNNYFQTKVKTDAHPQYMTPLIDLQKLNKKSFSLKVLTQINNNNDTLREINNSCNNTPKERSVKEKGSKEYSNSSNFDS